MVGNVEAFNDGGGEGLFQGVAEGLGFVHVSHGGDDLKAGFCCLDGGQEAETAGTAGDEDFFILVFLGH